MALYREGLEVQQISIIKKKIFIFKNISLKQFDCFLMFQTIIFDQSLIKYTYIYG